MLFPLIYIVAVILYNIFNHSIKYNEVSLFIVGLGFSKGDFLYFF